MPCIIMKARFVGQHWRLTDTVDQCVVDADKYRFFCEIASNCNDLKIVCSFGQPMMCARVSHEPLWVGKITIPNTDIDTVVLSRLWLQVSEGQIKIAIQFNGDLNRMGDSIQTLHDSIRLCDAILIRFRISSDLIQATRIYLMPNSNTWKK